ncbi:hypothetical protein KI387_008027, partial [Taxus chinensis]
RPTSWEGDEEVVDTIGESDAKGMMNVVGVANINVVGSSWDTTSDRVEEHKVEIVLAEVNLGVRVGGIDTGMSYTNYPDEYQ